MPKPSIRGERVNVVGHSLGGGIAMQFVTDFCETTDGARLTPDHWQPLLGDATGTP